MSTEAHTGLTRRLNLIQLTLYGLGTTIGAGIYALLSDIAQTAGSLAPWSFLVASILAAFSACSFAELSSRYPQAGATALYIERGFSHKTLALTIGIVLVVSAITSAAALVNGLVGYAQLFFDGSRMLIVLTTLLLVTLVSMWGISQSAWVAGIISAIEIGGVLWLTSLSTAAIDLPAVDWSTLVPQLDSAGVIVSGAVLSFYAYIGFEDMVEVAEEVKAPRKTLPRAIIATLLITSALYILLMTTTQLAVGTQFLAESNAPFADIYRHLTGQEPVAFMVIGLLAILNGVLIQMIMASRVLYGLASRDQLPRLLANVSSVTHTPLIATALVACATLVCALIGSLGGLAKITSINMLVVFGLANLALFRIKSQGEPNSPASSDDACFRVPRWLPLMGAIVCLGFIIGGVRNALI